MVYDHLVFGMSSPSSEGLHNKTLMMFQGNDEVDVIWKIGCWGFEQRSMSVVVLDIGAYADL